MEQMVLESLDYTDTCSDCGAELECVGVQALVGYSLRWDVESSCPACASVGFVCGDDLPADLRNQLLLRHGPARLQITDPSTGGATIMKVLRSELGIELMAVKLVLQRVAAGEYLGTLPEMELLARRLRDAGVAAVATRDVH